MHSNKIINANIEGGNGLGLNRVEVEDLVLSRGSSRSVLVLDPELRVVAADGVHLSNGELRVRSLGPFKANGPIDFNKQSMSSVSIVGGSVSNVSLVSAAVFRLLNYAPDVSTSSRIVLIGEQGDFRVLGGSESLEVNDLSVRSLAMRGNLDMAGFNVLAVNSLNSKQGKFDFLSVGSLKLSNSLIEKDCGAECTLLGLDSNGGLSAINLQSIMRGVVGTFTDFDSISVASLRLTYPESGVLYKNEKGVVDAVQRLNLETLQCDEIRVSKELSTNSFRVTNIVSSLLGTDQTGQVLGLTDISVNSINCENAVTRGEFTASTIKISSLSSDTGSSTRFLTVDDHGKILLASSSPRFHELRSQNIDASRVEAVDGRIQNLIAQTIEVVNEVNAEAVVAKRVELNGPAIFHNDVFISGSVSVEGSVIGSGPYVDSSDARFKRDISPIDNALDKVCALNGVVICTFSGIRSLKSRSHSSMQRLLFLVGISLSLVKPAGLRMRLRKSCQS